MTSSVEIAREDCVLSIAMMILAFVAVSMVAVLKYFKTNKRYYYGHWIGVVVCIVLAVAKVLK